MLGIDCSNYGGRPTPEQARAMRDAGYDFAIVGTQQESTANAQLAAFLGAGLRCEVYLYPYYNTGDPGRVERAIRIAKENGLRRVWDDVEWNDGGDGARPPVAVVVAGIGDRLAQIRGAGLDAGIYTSRHYWHPMTGGRLDAIIKENDTPLWHAQYTDHWPIPSTWAAFVPYGAWHVPLVWQYKGTADVAGFSVDLNMVNPGATLDYGLVVTTPPPAQEVITVQRALDALEAATATIWTHQDFEHVPSWDRAVLRRLFG